MKTNGAHVLGETAKAAPAGDRYPTAEAMLKAIHSIPAEVSKELGASKLRKVLLGK